MHWFQKNNFNPESASDINLKFNLQFEIEDKKPLFKYLKLLVKRKKTFFRKCNQVSKH